MAADQQPLIQKLDYNDDFVSVDNATRTLIIKRNHPGKKTVSIHIPSILYIRPASEVVGRVGLREQGKSIFSGIRWATDHSRGNALTGPRSGYKRSFVIKMREVGQRRGFSVEDPDIFLTVLEDAYPGMTGMAMETSDEDHRCPQHSDDREIETPSL